MRSKERKEINIIVGENIRKYRENAGYSREKFAELIDVSTNFISNVETASFSSCNSVSLSINPFKSF